MITYLLQVSISWVFFYLIYYVFLRKETYFHINRAYLMSALLIGLFIPQIGHYLIEWINTTPQDVGMIVYYVSETPYMISDAVQSTIDGYPWWMTILLSIYLSGVIIVGVKFFHGLFRIYSLYRSGQKTYKKEFVLIETDIPHLPFSFFQYVFLSNKLTIKKNIDHIIRHELTHIRSLHSLDIMTIELLSVLFWFNPILLFFKKAIKQSHEYQADASVLEHSTIKNYGQILLGQTTSGLEVALANHFFNSQIKNRITMMYQKKSERKALWKYLAAVPVLLLTMFLFSNSVLKDEVSEVDPLKSELTQLVQYAQSINDISLPSMEVIKKYMAKEEYSVTRIKDVIQEVNEETNIHFDLELDNGEIGKFCAVLDDDHPGFTSEVIDSVVPPNLLEYLGKKDDGTFPLIIIDGEITNPEDMQKLELNKSLRMKSINVLKPEIAVKKYGVQAKNGAIEITELSIVSAPRVTSPPTTTSGGEEIFTTVEEMPRFPGCEDIVDVEERDACAKDKLLKYIYGNLNYPDEAREKRVEGTVVTQFVVDKDGSIKNTRIVRNIGAGCGDAVLKVVNGMNEFGHWIPGKQRGKNVNVLYTLPVRFMLAGDEKEENNEHSGDLQEFKNQDFDKSVIGNKENVFVTGYRTANAGKPYPLIYINGQRLGFIENIEERVNLEDVKSVVVLKGKQAVEKYGEEAKDGVVLINIKVEKETQISVSLNDKEVKISRPIEISHKSDDEIFYFLDDKPVGKDKNLLETLFPGDIDRIEVSKEKEGKTIHEGKEYDGMVKIYTKGYKSKKADTPAGTDQLSMTDPERIIQRTRKDLMHKDFLKTMEVFPNPSTGKLNVRIEGDKDPIELQVVSIDGRRLYQEHINGFDGTFHKEIRSINFVNTTAFVMVIQGDKVQTKKVIFSE